MKRKPQMADVLTHEVKSCVNAYLMARAYAETMRERINAIYRDILTECPIYETRSGKPILDPERLYLCEDDALVRDAWDEANKRERAAGIKPDLMPDEHCPALAAEFMQTKAENMLIKASGAPFGVTNNSLLCAGLGKRQKWIDLIVSLVVSQPDFRNPLTGELSTNA